jgi:hypothetical protein
MKDFSDAGRSVSMTLSAASVAGCSSGGERYQRTRNLHRDGSHEQSEWPTRRHTTFSNQDRTHVIVDSVQILPDPAAAVRALETAKATTNGYVHGTPEPIAIGTSGTTIKGPSPDGAKGVTVLMFTEGRAFAQLEFDGPPDSLVPPDFVADVGQKQDAATKKELAG